MSYSHILIIFGEQSLVPFIDTLLADKYNVRNDIALKTDVVLLLNLRMQGMNMLISYRQKYKNYWKAEMTAKFCFSAAKHRLYRLRLCFTSTCRAAAPVVCASTRQIDILSFRDLVKIH